MTGLVPVNFRYCEAFSKEIWRGIEKIYSQKLDLELRPSTPISNLSPAVI